MMASGLDGGKWVGGKREGGPSVWYEDGVGGEHVYWFGQWICDASSRHRVAW
jgi:hypothetical protein